MLKCTLTAWSLAQSAAAVAARKFRGREKEKSCCFFISSFSPESACPGSEKLRLNVLLIRGDINSLLLAKHPNTRVEIRLRWRTPTHPV